MPSNRSRGTVPAFAARPEIERSLSLLKGKRGQLFPVVKRIRYGHRKSPFGCEDTARRSPPKGPVPDSILPFRRRRVDRFCGMGVVRRICATAREKAGEAGPQTEASVEWSGFGVQDLKFHVYTQILNFGPGTLRSRGSFLMRRRRPCTGGNEFKARADLSDQE